MDSLCIKSKLMGKVKSKQVEISNMWIRGIIKT